MTTSQSKFWKVFAKIAGRFRVSSITGKIRTAKGVCPVCAVANEIGKHDKWKCKYVSAADEIGLCTLFAGEISYAADDDTYLKRLDKIRAKMLAMMEAARAT